MGRRDRERGITALKTTTTTALKTLSI